MSVPTPDDLVASGESLVVAAFVADVLHIRIFDADGVMVVDKAKDKLISGSVLDALEQQLDPLPNVATLSHEDKRKIIEDAASLAAHTITDEAENSLDFSLVIPDINFTVHQDGTVSAQSVDSSLKDIPFMATVIGGQGNDHFTIEKETVVQVALDGGIGEDTLDYSAFTTDLNIDLSDPDGTPPGTSGVVGH